MRIKNLNLQTTLWSAQLTIECDIKEAAELQRIIDEAGKIDSEAFESSVISYGSQTPSA